MRDRNLTNYIHMKNPHDTRDFLNLIFWQQQNITGFSMQFWENIFKRMMIIYLNISIVFE